MSKMKINGIPITYGKTEIFLIYKECTIIRVSVYINDQIFIYDGRNSDDLQTFFPGGSLTDYDLFSKIMKMFNIESIDSISTKDYLSIEEILSVTVIELIRVLNDLNNLESNSKNNFHGRI